MPRTFSYNKSIRVETRREKLTGDTGALLSPAKCWNTAA